MFGFGNSGVTLRVRGDRATKRALMKLTPRLRRRVLAKATRDAMRPTLKQAKANAPRRKTRKGAAVKGGQLRKSLKLRAMKRSRVKVGAYVATAGGWFKGRQFYGAFQEFGWKAGKRGSDNRTEIEGRHFAEQAYKSERRGALRLFTDLVRRNLKQAIETGGVK